MNTPLVRNLIKTLNYATTTYGASFTSGYLMTGSVGLAAGLALIEPVTHNMAPMLHEQAGKLLHTAGLRGSP
jgi:uncharacterized membrane protein